MMLGLRAVATCLPAVADHKSLLGPVVPAAYRHLYDPAGKRSRPPIVPRGVFTAPCAPYAAPTAAIEERIADLASESVRRLLLTQPGAAARVRAILHAQCTLDQQILGSTCLRIEHDHFARAASSATIGQLGTAGLPTVLRLVADDLARCTPQALGCVSAADKWAAPFIRHVPGLVTYGDAAAAVLVGRPLGPEDDIAELQALECSTRALAYDLWTADAERQRAALLDHVEAVVRPLLQGDGPLWLFGDGYGAELTDRLAERLGWPAERAPAAEAPGHLSSAAGLFSVAQAVKTAVELGRDIDAVVWTASPAGHAGALRLRCHAAARRATSGWCGRRAEHDAVPDGEPFDQPSMPDSRRLETTP